MKENTSNVTTNQGNVNTQNLGVHRQSEIFAQFFLQFKFEGKKNPLTNDCNEHWTIVTWAGRVVTLLTAVKTARHFFTLINFKGHVCYAKDCLVGCIIPGQVRCNRIVSDCVWLFWCEALFFVQRYLYWLLWTFKHSVQHPRYFRQPVGDYNIVQLHYKSNSMLAKCGYEHIWRQLTHWHFLTHGARSLSASLIALSKLLQ